MCVIEDKEIVGYLVGEECICRECINVAEASKMKLNNLIIEESLKSGDRYFCDRCYKEIT